MSGIANILPWGVSFLLSLGIVSMQAIGGGGRPMFPLMVCYLPILAAGLLSVPAILLGTSKRSPDMICMGAAGVFGVYMVVRTCFGGDPGLRDFELMRLCAVFLVYLVTVAVVTAKGPRLLFLAIVISAAFLQTCIEIYQFYCDQEWSPMMEACTFLTTYYPATVGTYANKNHLAWLLADGSLFAIALAFWGRLRWVTRGLLFYLFFFLGFGVCISLSRGGVVALLAGLIVFASVSVILLLLGRDRGRLLAGILAGMLVAAASAGAVSFFSSNPVLGLRMQAIWMDVYREDLWRASIHDLGVAPFFGMGAGSFQWCARLMMPAESILAHNDYAQLLSEYGLIGVLMLMVFLTGHLRAGFSAVFRHRGQGGGVIGSRSNSGAILLGALAVVSAQLVHSAFDFNMHLSSNALLAAFSLGILGRDGLHGWRRPLSLPIRLGLGVSVLALVLTTCLLTLKDWSRELRYFHLEQYLAASSSSPGGHPVVQAAADADQLLSEVPDNSRYADMRVALHRMLVSMPEDGFSETDAGIALLRRLGRVLDSDGGNWYLRMNQSFILWRLGDEEGGRRAFLRAMVRMPLYAMVYQDHAALLELQGEPADALHYGRIAQRFKDAGGLEPLIRRMEDTMSSGSAK